MHVVIIPIRVLIHLINSIAKPFLFFFVVIIMEKIKIYAVGDCNTEGANSLPPGESIPEKLASVFESSGLSVTLVNLGQTMTTTREGLTRVQNEVTAPDILLINFGLVDAWVTSIPQVYVPYYPDNRWRKLGRKLIKSIKKLLRKPILNKMVTHGEVVSSEEYLNNFKEMIRIARSRNPEVKILLWSTTFALNDPQRNENIHRYNCLLKELAVTSDTLYLDISELVGSLQPSDAYLDDVHLSGKSSALIAETMVKLLKTNQ
jgi:lysophospholipase L1-like esterase